MSLQAHLHVEGVEGTDRGNILFGITHEPYARIARGPATGNLTESAGAPDKVEPDEDEPVEPDVPGEEILDETEDLTNETGDFFDSNPE